MTMAGEFREDGTVETQATPETVTFVLAGIDDLALDPAPIDPAWVLEGQPQARAALHSRSDDDAATTSVWDCTAGRFRWHFGWDETAVILEGGVRVTTEDGRVHDVKAGDVVFFAAGTWATWEVASYVRKVAFCRRVFPSSVQLALRLRDRLRDIVKASVGVGVTVAAAVAAEGCLPLVERFAG